jgi:fatty acid desaturase
MIGAPCNAAEVTVERAAVRKWRWNGWRQDETAAATVGGPRPKPGMTSMGVPATGSRAALRRALLLCAALLAANVAAWIWAWAIFASAPELLAVCAVVYGLGLRHAVDADHITAIDNVTRKMMQDGKRPVGVGLFFSLGHSTIVVALSNR